MRTSVIFLMLFCGVLSADVMLFEKVEKVGVGIHGYTLGKVLTQKQRGIADKNLEKANVEGTYKFKDGSFHIIADAKSHRVVVIYKRYEMVDTLSLKHLVSQYIGTFEDPTTVSHNNIIYWLYHENGHKISLDEFESWRAKTSAKQQPQKSLKEMLLSQSSPNTSNLHQLVTVKLQSQKPFWGNESFIENSVYLMISSEDLIRKRYSL